MNKFALLSGSLFAMISIVLGAFGAHYLKSIFTPELLLSFETGVRYQFYHAVALLFVGLFQQFAYQSMKWVTRFFVAGIILFSGSIYLLCLFKSNGTIGLKGLGILTPIGGVLFILAWILLSISILQLKLKKS
jgi:uncharacterized membrane protein YgdD (TMEM256/DUF423 family)